MIPLVNLIVIFKITYIKNAMEKLKAVVLENGFPLRSRSPIFVIFSRDSPTVCLNELKPSVQYVSPRTGAWTTPSSGSPFSIRAILTVNSPFLFMNSFVPSRGSTNQKLFHFFLSS